MKLFTLAEVGGETAGFLVPIFEAYSGANQKLVQQIGEDNNVIAFDPVVLENCQKSSLIHDVETEVGKPAIWAFRDHTETVHIGTYDQIHTICLQLLSERSLQGCPMAAAEVVAFCQAEILYPNVLKAAMTALAKQSELGAKVWRDTTVLLPLIKQDIAAQLHPSTRMRKDIESVYAITRGHVTHIYAPQSIIDVAKLPRWKILAGIFGIRQFEIHQLRKPAERASNYCGRWSLRGVGGIARFVITRSPFFGVGTKTAETPADAIANGSILTSARLEASDYNLDISIVPSDIEQALRITYSPYGKSPNSIVHAINVRPIGFGTPQKGKPRPSEIIEAARGLDYLWIIANHRQRKIGNAASSLSASNMASRFVRATAAGLITCLSNQDGIQFLDSTRGKREIGLVGATRFTGTSSMEELSRRVLLSMLCEDAYLHSAKRIVLLWPREVADYGRYHQIAIGEHRYNIEIIPRPRSPSWFDIVGYAMDVQESARTEDDFRDFCISLASGYGYVHSSYNNHRILVQNGPRDMWLWPTTSASQASYLCNAPAERDASLIVTNWSIPSPLEARARLNGWDILHYSELGRWIGSYTHSPSPGVR